MRGGGEGVAGESAPRCCALLLHTHTRMYIFAFFVLLGSFGKRYKHSPTYTHSHRDNDVVAQPARASAAARESERAGETTSPLAAVQASNEWVQNDEVRLKYVSKPNNCRYCHYFWPTFKWKRERALATPLSLCRCDSKEHLSALLANKFSFNVYSL